MKLREASTQDLPQLRSFEQEMIAFERPFDPAITAGDATYYDLEALLSDTSSQLLVLEVADQLVGSGYAQIRPSKPYHTHEVHCYLGFIYLDPDQRGKGLGQVLVNGLTEWGESQGVRHFHLDVYAENASAIRAYENAGFTKALVQMKLTV